MGNHRFRLLDMMPNAWFYKLRDMNNKPHPFTKKKTQKPPPPPPPTPNQTQPLLPNRASYYFPSNSPHHPTHFLHRAHQLSSTTSSVSDSDVVGPELVLRPILTKPPAPPPAKARSSPPTVGSPVNRRRKVRLQARRGGGGGGGSSRRRRRGIDESFAVVKSSSEPRRDFRESMVEMILENRLTSSRDLEHLLACYLLLNSAHYHRLIVDVFQEIWFDMHRRH